MIVRPRKYLFHCTDPVLAQVDGSTVKEAHKINHMRKKFWDRDDRVEGDLKKAIQSLGRHDIAELQVDTVELTSSYSVLWKYKQGN